MWRAISKAKSFKYLLSLTWLLAILVRIYLTTLPAQPYDIGTYQAWGNLMGKLGPVDFFASTWSDYLPLPIYLFAAISRLATFLHFTFPLVFKLFFSAIELGLIVWITRLTKSKLLPFLLLLSPALILDTSWWGQTDSFPALIILLSFLLFKRELSKPNKKSRSNKSLYLSATLTSLAISFKPIVALTLPVFMILYLASPHRPKLTKIVLAIFLAALLFLLPALFVNPNPIHALQFLIDKTLEQASTYPYTSINAFNFWNIRSTLQTWPPDNQLLLGLSLQSWGYLIFALLSLNTLRMWHKAKWNKKHAPRVIATILAIFFTFTTRMHERHLLFALPFLALSVTTSPWLLIPYLIYTLLFSFNLFSAYSWVINDQTWPVQAIYANLAALLTTLTTIYLATVWSSKHTLKKAKAWLVSHRVLTIILILAGSLRLTNLGYPKAHIFDEVYHAFTAQELLANNLSAWIWWDTPPEGFAYEWTHPPVAKYGMVTGLVIFGDGAYAWRFFSAIMGILSLYGVFQLTLKLFKSPPIASLATFLVSIEGLHLVQSRIAMNDIYMLAFLIWSLNFALDKNWKKSALLFGLSLASKWSALYGLFPLALIYLHSTKLNIRSILFSFRLLLISLFSYLLTYTPFFLSGYTWSQLTELHRQMWYYHTNLLATHSYQSTPGEWIFSLRPVWYFVDYGEKVGNIYATSNPLLLWFGLVALILSLRKLKVFKHRLLLLLYLAFILPWVFSPRIMFFYHYLPSATFLMIILASWLSSLPARTRILLLILFTLAFLLLSPVFYGFPVSPTYWDTLFSLFPTWK